jgi:transposase
MARPRRIDNALVAKARQVVARTADIEQLRAAQAVLLPAVASATLEQTAAILGVGRATVVRLQHRFSQSVGPATKRPRWGGRRKALLSVEQEAQFLAPWAEQAKEASVLVLSPIRAALAKRLGRPVAASVVWRLLARHGWRKVAPDTRHPKSDPVAQQAWKKNSPKRWLPSRSKPNCTGERCE